MNIDSRDDKIKEGHHKPCHAECNKYCDKFVGGNKSKEYDNKEVEILIRILLPRGCHVVNVEENLGLGFNISLAKLSENVLFLDTLRQ